MKNVILLFVGLVFACTAMAQTREISGTVSDVDGGPLPGVTVLEVGTSTGTVTDVDGKYKIKVSSDTAKLGFQFVGMQKKEVAVGSMSVLDVTMEENVFADVVVTGYGIEVPENEITYQTAKIKSEDIMTGQQQSLAASLAGKIPGLQVSIQSNGVNPQTKLLLRGFRSITQSNDPLVIIDGAVSTMGAFNDLNPPDLEKIDFIKGASASSLYGSRGVNGAVVVTTKSGRSKKGITVGLNTSYTVETVAYMPDFQTEYGIGWDGHYDRIENTNWGPRFDGVDRKVGPSFPEGHALQDQVLAYAPIQDNLKDFYQNGSTLQNTFYVSGAGDGGKYYASVSQTKTNGIVMNDQFERITVRFNASQKIGKLQVGLNTSYYQDETNVVGSTIGDQDRPLYWFVLNTPANIPLSNYKDWRNPASYAHADNYYNAYYQNPYWAVGTNRDNDESYRMMSNVHGKYTVNDNINVLLRLGMNNLRGTGREWRDAQTYDPDLQSAHSAVSSFVTDSEFQTTSYNGNLLVNGKYKLSDQFAIKPMVGASFIDDYSRSSSIRANNISIPGFYDISNGTGQLVGSVNETRKRTTGFFANVNLGYNDWAFINLAGRQDYTSTLPSGDNSYFYPSVSAAAELTKGIPAIQQALPFISFAKVTLSNVITFNDLGAYQASERYSQQGSFPFGTINGFEVSSAAVDAGITKEKLNTWEFGWNLAFLNDRLAFNGSVFNTVTKDLITFTTPSFASGANSLLTNIGQTTNKGYELSMKGKVLEFGDFRWDASVNYSKFETIVDEIEPGPTRDEVAIVSWAGGSYGVFAVEGMPFPQLKAQGYARDDRGRVIVDPISGDPVLGEVIALGKTTPDYILGGTSKFSYKGLSLSATVDYRTGHVYYEQGSDAMEFTGRSVESVSADRQDFVFPNSVYQSGVDDDGNPIYTENNSVTVSNGRMGFWQNAYNDVKENYVKDATAFKLRELAISYRLPKSITKKMGVNRLTIGFVGRNLLTTLPEENNFADPEFNNSTGNGFGIGGYFTSPPTRSIGFNINIEI